MPTNSDNLTPVERELEDALRALKPAAADLDRDRLMFEAGRRSARSHLHAWQAAAAVMVIGMGLSWVMRPAGAPADHIHHDASPPAEAFVSLASTTAFTGETSYGVLRGRVLTDGADALITRPADSDQATRLGPDTEGSLLRSREQLNNL